MLKFAGKIDKKKAPLDARLFFYGLIITYILQLANICCCRTFLAIDNVKANPPTFVKALVTIPVNCSVMDENIVSTIFLLNKTKSL